MPVLIRYDFAPAASDWWTDTPVCGFDHIEVGSPGGEVINGQSIVVDGSWTATKCLPPRATTSQWECRIDLDCGGRCRIY